MCNMKRVSTGDECNMVVNSSDKQIFKGKSEWVSKFDSMARIQVQRFIDTN